MAIKPPTLNKRRHSLGLGMRASGTAFSKFASQTLDHAGERVSVGVIRGETQQLCREIGHRLLDRSRRKLHRGCAYWRTLK